MNTKKSKLLVMTLCLLLVGTVFTFNVEADKPDELLILSTDTGPTYSSRATDAFSEEYGIDVEWQVVPYDDFFTQLTTMISGGVPVDVFWMGNSWHAELGEMGMAIPLEDYYSEEEYNQVTDKFFPASVEKMSSHDKTWGLPIITSPYYFFYNEEMLAELGYDSGPETWNEVIEISEEAMDAGLADYGLVLGWQVGEALMAHFDNFLKLHGGQWINEDHTEFTFNSDEGIEALEFMVELIERGVVSESSLEIGDWDSPYSFLAGNTPFEMNWGVAYSMINDPDESEVKDKARSILVPGIGENRSYSTVGGGGWSVGATTRSQEWAFKLAEYATNEMAARDVLDDKHAEATIVDVVESPEFDDDEFMQIYQEQLNYTGFRPADFLTWYSYFRDEILAPNIHDALHGNLTPEEALNEAFEEAQERLEAEGI